MRKSIVSAAIAASFIASAAFAAAQSDTGAIKTLDVATHQLTLADGKAFVLPTSWKGTGFKIGDKVKVTYQTKSGKMSATAVTHVS